MSSDLSESKPIEVSNFEKLTGISRILEHPDYNVWCCSPIYGPDGKVRHLLFSLEK